MAKRWKCILAAAGLGWMLFSSVQVGAFEPYYLNGDQTLPMIQNTGGIYNDGTTGLFLDLSTMEIEDVFSDGLAAKVNVSDISQSNIVSVNTIHVRFAEDGRAWALRNDGKWQEVSEGSEDPASLAVYFVRQEMGDEKRRDDFMTQIEKISEEKTGALESVVPAEAIPLIDVPVPEVKEPVKKAIEKTKKTKTQGNKKVTPKEIPAPEVTVTITEAPQVEILQQPQVQVEVN